VYLKNVSRIVGLLTAYFFALMAQALLERELRQSMAAQGVKSLPLYPEGRACTRPTTGSLMELFEPIHRHRLRGSSGEQVVATELNPLQHQILKLLGIRQNQFDI
jgi:hypothetical protein